MDLLFGSFTLGAVNFILIFCFPLEKEPESGSPALWHYFFDLRDPNHYLHWLDQQGKEKALMTKWTKHEWISFQDVFIHV